MLLLGLFWACGGFVLPRGAFDSPIYFKHNPVIPWVLIILCFGYGAVLTVWGDQTVGIIHPISFRSGYIALGVLLMLAALLLTCCVRVADSRQPIRPAGASSAKMPGNRVEVGFLAPVSGSWQLTVLREPLGLQT